MREAGREFFNDVHAIGEIDYWDMIERCWEAETFDGLELRQSRVAAPR